jgi:diguanylate cyclase (GGDEF)-like protein
VLTAAAAGYAIAALRARRHYQPTLAAARAQATHDPLTGLPNRRAAIAEVHHRSNRGPFLLVLLDLDDFKSINDHHGHLAGDHVLHTVASRLQRAVAPGGFAARLGGDEFVLVLPDPGGDPTPTVRAILARLASPVVIGAVRLRPHACAGVATGHDDAVSWRHLIACADRALYRAKRDGRTMAIFDPDIDGQPDSPPDHRPPIRRRDRGPTARPNG